MFRRVASFVLAFLVASFVLWGCGDAPKVTAPTQSTVPTVTGTLFGVYYVDRDSLPTTALQEFVAMVGKPIDNGSGTTVINKVDGGKRFEVRRTYPTAHLSLEIGGQPAKLNTDGSFTVDNVSLGRQTANFKIDGIVVRSDTVRVAANDKIRYDVEYKPKPCPLNHGPHPNAGSYPCLDNNGIWPVTFIYSDCYMALFYSKCWQYTWMCWSESMDRIHDHMGNIWCNGSQNCSLFVHGWDWNMQKWHTHSSFWTTKC